MGDFAASNLFPSAKWLGSFHICGHVALNYMSQTMTNLVTLSGEVRR